MNDREMNDRRWELSPANIGHSTGGGEETRYVARHGKGRVAKAVLISSVPPVLLKGEKNPDGLPLAVLDQLREGTALHRSQFYQDITMPFYDFNRPGAKISQGIRDNWWRQGMMGGAKAQYDCVKALSETDFFEDPQEHRCPGAGDAWPGRLDLPIREQWSKVSEDGETWNPENVRRFPARHADDQRRPNQCRLAGVLQRDCCCRR
jgi:pimeloyl-ACP methyl ester carboxylesterase